MSTYCRILIHKSRSAVESALMSAFDVDRLLTVPEAESGDFLLSEGNDCVALDEVESGPFLQDVAMEPEFLVELSRACDARITAIAVFTGTVWVSILVADRGRIIRRFLESDEVEIDEGELPDWDERIRFHSWNAADDLVGMPQWQPEPGFVTLGIRKLASVFGYDCQPKSRRAELLARFGFGEPVAAISAKRFHAKMNLQATGCRFDGPRLVCTFSDGSELSLFPSDVEHVLLETAFRTNKVIFKLRDRRVMTLPATYASEFPAIERWWKTGSTD